MNTILKWIEWNECVFSWESGRNKDIINLMQANPMAWYIVMDMLDSDDFFEHKLKVIK